MGTVIKNTRRDFLKGAALVASAAASQGCVASLAAKGGEGGAPMRNFKCAPMERVRVGVVGVGARGIGAVRRLGFLPGVEVAAVCDIRPECADCGAKAVVEASGRKPAVFAGGNEEYKRLCDSGLCDVVYNATSWDAHVPVSAYAMKAGMHTFIEVPAAPTVDGCWELVETAEKTRRHCMQLENCCYGEDELLALNLCRLGLLGVILHGEGGYIHDRRTKIFDHSQWNDWRRRWNEVHSGNQYSTHGLGPIALDMGINYGDRFDYLVSVDGQSLGYRAYAAAALPKDDPQRNLGFAMSDMNVTLIRTMAGRTIMLQHDVTTPRPYSRLNLISGTKGVFRSYPRYEVYLEGKDELPTSTSHHEFDPKFAEQVRKLYSHPMYVQAGEIAKKAGGHGGMDFLMDLRWSYCLRQGLPLDTDVYDLAAWCAVGELSERSARNRSAAVDFPDFTRGVWKRKCNSNLMDAKFDMSKLGFSSVGPISGQMNV